MQLENLFPTGRYGSDGRSFVYKPDGTQQFIALATSDGTTWTLTTAGAALALTEGAGGATIVTGAGTKTGSTVSVVELGDLVRKTVVTFAATPQTVPFATNTQFVGTKFYTFPQGRILVLGVTASLAQTTTSILASTINASKTGALALGTVTASDQTLDSTMANLLPSTAFTSSATINVAGTAVTAALAASAQFDGTTTAIDAYLNSAYATDLDVDAAGTQTWSGTVTISWINLGDY